MKLNFNPLTLVPLIALGGLLGGWLGQGLQSPTHAPTVAPTAQTAIISHLESPVRAKQPRLYRDEFRDCGTVEMFASSLPNEVILRFPSEATYRKFFLSIASSRLQLVDRLDRLRALRIAYDDWQELAILLQSENITTYDSLAQTPAPSLTQGGSQEGSLGFGNSLIRWLGITTDHRRWGAGVKIAVIDSGIIPHPALPGLRKSIAITPFSADLTRTNGHGTAVASLIASNDPAAMGLAPAAELISIRVGDDSGKADSFALAAGILAALDEGVQLINISMGTSEDNPLIEQAVLLAQAQDVLIIAAAGNSEQADASYPAAYPSVISVGAVDARGSHLDFSNFGTYLTLTAPGYALRAAHPGGGFTTFSGTSASTPIVTGAIAATMSSGIGIQMSARQAIAILMSQADDAGIPGPDTEYGVGILNMARVMNRATPGLLDAAITGQRLVRSTTPGNSDAIQVTVQNRGTVRLRNGLLEIHSPLGSRRFTIAPLAPGEVETFSLPVRLPGLPHPQAIQVDSKIHLAAPASDFTPHNNQASDSILSR